jgi:hypothetical protein
LNKIQLTWKMDYGVPGCDTDNNSPVARAVSYLFEKGKPFSNLCMCFFRAASATLRWFGVFVQSAGDRVIYFPGFVKDFDQIQGFQGKNLRWNKSFILDHISLEKDRLKWHLTPKESKDHSRDRLGSPRTLMLGKNRVLWLGISVADAHVLRVVKRETKIVFDSPPGDSIRRSEIFRKAQEGAKFPIVSPNTEHLIPLEARFLHFGIIVGPKGFENYSGGELGFPYGSPCLVKPLPEELSKLPIRSHRLELSNNTDIQITVCYLPGRLKLPVAITSPSEPSVTLNTQILPDGGTPPVA